MQLPLSVAKWKEDGRISRAVWRSSKPFVENRLAVLIHRPKEITSLAPSWRKGRYAAIHCFCGAGFTGGDASGAGKFTFLDEPPADAIVCARCEAAAVANGLPSSEQIAGRHVHIGGVKAVRHCCENEPE